MDTKQIPIVFVMIGLPCRGKSYWSKNLRKFMQKNQVELEIFNLGEFRRRSQIFDEDKAKFFEQENQETQTSRDLFAQMALDEMKKYLQERPGRIAIFDGTNTTLERRDFLRQQLCSGKYIVIWLEMNSENEQRIDQYIRNSKIFNGDYQNSKMSQEEKFQDFKNRIKKYQEVYIPFTDQEKTIVKNDQNQQYIFVGEFGEIVDKKLFQVLNENLGLIDKFIMNLESLEN